MIDFPAGSEELLRKIARANGKCLILKNKSCFSDKWRHKTDFLEIGRCHVRGRLSVYVGIVPHGYLFLFWRKASKSFAPSTISMRKSTDFCCFFAFTAFFIALKPYISLNWRC